MSYSDFVKPRMAVLSDDGIDGIVDLANLKATRRRKLEAKPEDFFALTYPTSEIKRVLDRLNTRFKREGDTPALFLFEGLKGSGKSHLLVLIYHLLQNPKEGAAWLKQHDLVLTPPQNTVVVTHKYTDQPLLRIWDFVFSEAKIKISGKYEVYPSAAQIQEALGDRHLVLILDELEVGIRMIQDAAIQKQNIAFLQMLSELGNRSPQVTIFSSVYDVDKEPGATLVRVPCVRVQFARATSADRAKVVLHRIFENYLDFDPNSASSTIDSCVNAWRRHLPTFDAQTTRTRLMESYPFHPDLLTLILERVPARGGFQNIRGSLGFLANLVRITHTKTDLITAGNATLSDRETAIRLQDLDPTGILISRAKENMEELQQQSALSDPLASTTMLYTLTGDGRNRGATREDLVRHVVLPSVDINEFEQALLAFQKYASHFHVADGRYYFDREENADAKVEFRSLTIDQTKAKARTLLRSIWKGEVFRESTSAVVFTAADETKTELEELDKNRLRFVLAPRRLSIGDRHDLYRGLSMRNQVLLLEPKADDFNLDGNADLIKWAQRCLAAAELADQAGQAGDAERKTEYERIGRDDRRNIAEAIKRAGLVFIRFEMFGASAEADRAESENLPGQSREDVLRHLSQQLYPVMVFQEDLRNRLDQIKGKLVRDIDREYRESLGFPVPTTVATIGKALREICLGRLIGIYHTSGNFCGNDPNLTETELMEAQVGEPFDRSPAPTPRPPVPTPGTSPPLPPPPPPPPPTEPAEEVKIPFKMTAGALRQEIGSKLAAIADVRVRSIKFQIFSNEQAVDFSSMSAGLRGNLSGQGTLGFEINLGKQGDMTKAQVEQLCEQLPQCRGAQYSARMEIVRPKS